MLLLFQENGETSHLKTFSLLSLNSSGGERTKLDGWYLTTLIPGQRLDGKAWFTRLNQTAAFKPLYVATGIVIERHCLCMKTLTGLKSDSTKS